MINVKCLSEKKHTSCWTISSKHENLLVWRWSRAPVSAEMIKLRRSEWLCRTGTGCTIHPPMPQCTYQDTYQHTYQPTRNLLAHPATYPSHLPIAQKKRRTHWTSRLIVVHGWNGSLLLCHAWIFMVSFACPIVFKIKRALWALISQT